MKKVIMAAVMLIAASCNKQTEQLQVDSVQNNLVELQFLIEPVVTNLAHAKDIHEFQDGQITFAELKTLAPKMNMSYDQARLFFIKLGQLAKSIHAKSLSDGGIDNIVDPNRLLACQNKAIGIFASKVGGVGAATTIISAAVTGVGVFFVGLVLTGALIAYVGDMQDCDAQFNSPADGEVFVPVTIPYTLVLDKDNITITIQPA